MFTGPRLSQTRDSEDVLNSQPVQEGQHVPPRRAALLPLREHGPPQRPHARALRLPVAPERLPEHVPRLGPERAQRRERHVPRAARGAQPVPGAHLEQLVRDAVRLGAQDRVERLVRAERPEDPLARVSGWLGSGREGGSGDGVHGDPGDDRFDDAVVPAVGEEPARRGMAEDQLLGRPVGRNSPSVCVDLVLNILRYECERGCVAENL